MVDPSRLDEGAGIGLNLRPFAGFGVLVAMTVFEEDTIRGDLAKKGDTWVGEGDLPIDKELSRRSIGVFVGLAADTSIVKALLP
jgi:hypothetical protein